jgi:hypothetical protein
MRSIICAKLFASPIRVILDPLRCGSSACDLCGSEPIGQMLQYFDFSDTQGFQQSDALIESHLETSSTPRIGGKECAGLDRGRHQRPFVVFPFRTKI